MHYYSPEEDEQDYLKPKTRSICLEISKKRHELGRPTSFSDQPASMLEEVMPNRELEKEYIKSVVMSRAVQAAQEQSMAGINTARTEMVSQGMNHTEGGWPKDINCTDPEQTSRYRKKFEKDEVFIDITKDLVKEVEKSVKQNNCINIFEEYFDTRDKATENEEPTVKTVAVYKDILGDPHDRAISGVSWSPTCEKIALAFCNLEFLAYQLPIDKTSFIYNIEDPLTPILHITPQDPLVCLQYSKKDPNLLAGGTLTGQVALVDCRLGGSPQAMACLPDSKGDPVNDLTWISSKMGTEVLAAVADGSVARWDVRQMKAPLDMFSLNSNQPADCAQHGATCIDYDPTVPYRFLVGSDQGATFSFSRKAKPGTENILATYSGHFGPVNCVQRNPSYQKIFLTVGDWCARVWSEDAKHSSIMTTINMPEKMTAGCWSPTRPSVFITGRGDGVVQTWDLKYQQTFPLLTTKVSDEPITSLKFNETGSLVMAGSCSGTATLLELSPNLVTCAKEERQVISCLFERETRRERVLGTIEKEEQMRKKTSEMMQPQRDIHAIETCVAEKIKMAEENFFEAIKKEREIRVAHMGKLFAEEKYI